MTRLNVPFRNGYAKKHRRNPRRPTLHLSQTPKPNSSRACSPNRKNLREDS